MPDPQATDREALRLTDDERRGLRCACPYDDWHHTFCPVPDIERVVAARVERAITDARAVAHAEHIDDHDEGFTLGEKTGYREGVRQAKAAAEAVLAETDGWTPYDSRDTGETFLAESVRDLVADLRTALSDLGGNQ